MSRHHCPKIAQEVMCETGLHNSHWICMLGIGTAACAWWKISQWDTRWMCVSEIKIPYQGDSREDFQQGNQVVSISQVLIQVCDVLPHLRERQGCKGRREGAGTDRKWTGRRKKREKEKKKVNFTLQSSLCWHLSGRLPHSWQAWWQRLPGQQRWSTSCALLSPLPWCCLEINQGGSGSSLLAVTDSDSASGPSRAISISGGFVWKWDTQWDGWTDRQTETVWGSAERENWIKQRRVSKALRERGKKRLIRQLHHAETSEAEKKFNAGNKNRCPVPLEPQIPTDTHVKVPSWTALKSSIKKHCDC